MTHPIVVIRQPGHTPVHLSVREPVEIGRECGGLILADPQVSRRHAVIRPARGEGVEIDDLGSTNGTFVASTRLTKAVRLTPGVVVRLGQTTVELEAPVRQTPARSQTSKGTMIGGAPPTGGDAPDGRVRPAAGADADIRRTSIEMVAEAARESGPIAQHVVAGDQGTVTIVFSDIESSTDRALAVGDTVWMEMLETHNDIIRQNLTKFGGREIKNQGDGFMLSFPGARRALLCMIAVQRELDQLEKSRPEVAVKIRIGLHTGEVIADSDGDLFGKHVIIAARIANLASGGEILASSLVKEISSARGDIDFGDPRQVELKGVGGEHLVYPVLWETSAAVDS
ncbi:MAG: adenylate/guanylate cyclase domain-containing protein [Acidimicrobiales bacterium]